MTPIAFLGTPAAAVPSLKELSKTCEIGVVITRPDRPRGRSKAPVPSPVKEAAADLGLPVAQPANHRQVVEALDRARPLDLAVLVAFGMLIRPEALEIPRWGFVNAHFSLLPRWRGAAPVQRAIMAGDDLTGVTIIQMDEGLDTGPVLRSTEVPIASDVTAGELTELLSGEAAHLMGETVPLLLENDVEATPQPSQGATKAPPIRKDEAHLDFFRSAGELERDIRALNPRPGAFAWYHGGRIKIWRAAVAGDDRLEVGQLAGSEGSLLVGCGSGVLELLEVQPAGRRPMSGADWSRGRRGELGTLA